jgi:hypothetical protein
MGEGIGVKAETSVYISGPISLGGTLPPDEIERNRQRFIDEQIRLEAAGFKVLNPTQQPQVEGWKWIDYMVLAIRLLSEADFIYLMEGWEKSDGCRIENAIAKSFGIENVTNV